MDRQRIIGIGFCIAACGMTLAGMMNGFTGFIALLLLAAVGTSSFHPVGLVLIDETAISERGKVFGFFILLYAAQRMRQEQHIGRD